MGLFGKKKAEPWQPRVPVDLLQLLGPFDHPALPNVEVGRFVSPYSGADDLEHDIVLLSLVHELVGSQDRYAIKDLPAADSVGTLTADLIQLVESRVTVDAASLYPLMSRLTVIGTYAAGLENLNFGLPYRGYERHFVLAVDLIADQVSAYSGYVALGRYCAAANYYLTRAAVGFAKEVALGVDQEILSRARESLDQLVHRLPPGGWIPTPS